MTACNKIAVVALLNGKCDRNRCFHHDAMGQIKAKLARKLFKFYVSKKSTYVAETNFLVRYLHTLC